MKRVLIVSLLVSILVLTSCKRNSIGYTYINGELVDNRLVNSGYYLTKASMSDALLSDALNMIEKIEKPSPLGTCDLPDMSTIEIDVAELDEITDAMVEAYIEEKRDNDMTYQTIKTGRAAKIGDKAVIDFVGKMNGVPFEGGTGKSEEIILGSGVLVPGFEEQIVGHKAGERFDIYVTFPKDYAEQVRGKTAQFNVTINYLQEPVTPELDADFIRKKSKIGATTSEAFREEVRSILKFKQQYKRDEDAKNKLLSYLLENCVCTPSELGLAWRFSKTLLEQKRFAEIQNISFVEQIANTYSLRDVLEQYKLQTGYVIYQDMVLEALQNMYKIKVNDDDLYKWYKDIETVNEYGSDVTYDLYKNSMGYDYVYDNAYKDKILQEAIKHIKINYISLEEN